MNKKELLELAAKACGIPIVWVKDWRGKEGIGRQAPPPDDDMVALWNPIHHDGDYSRMEAQLEITSKWLPLGVIVESSKTTEFVFKLYADHNDKQAARRYAGVRLAAEIGREMK